MSDILDDNNFSFKELHRKGCRKKVLIRLMSLLFYMVFWTFVTASFWILSTLLFGLKETAYPSWLNTIFILGYIAGIAYAAYQFVCLLIELLQENHYVYFIDIQRIEEIGEGYAGKIYFENPIQKKQFGQLEGKEWHRKKAAIYQCFQQKQPIEIVIGKYSKQIWEIAIIEDERLNF